MINLNDYNQIGKNYWYLETCRKSKKLFFPYCKIKIYSRGCGNKILKLFCFVCLPLLSSRPFIPRKSNSFSLVSYWFIINLAVSDRNFPFIPPISWKTNLPVQTRMNIENKRLSLDETKLLVDLDWNKYHLKGGKNPLSIGSPIN